MALTESTAYSTGGSRRLLTLAPPATITGRFGDDAPVDEWLPEVAVQVKELLLLEDAWDGDVGTAIDSAAVGDALRFLEVVASARRLLRPFVTPTANGGVNLEWHSTDAHFDVTFEGGDAHVYASSSGFDWEGSLAELTPDAAAVLATRFRR